MKMLSHKDVVSTFIAYCRSQNEAVEKARIALKNDGYVETSHDGIVLPDGREVYEMFGKRWVLQKDVYEDRKARALEMAISRDVAIAAANPETAETKSVAGTDDLARMICPKCGDSLQYSTVCGACAAGKAGYRHRYSCVHGCVDLVSKEKV